MFSEQVDSTGQGASTAANASGHCCEQCQRASSTPREPIRRRLTKPACVSSGRLGKPKTVADELAATPLIWGHHTTAPDDGSRRRCGSCR